MTLLTLTIKDMQRAKISVSMRRFVRREKARIRREALDRVEAEYKIRELVIATHKTRAL